MRRRAGVQNDGSVRLEAETRGLPAGARSLDVEREPGAREPAGGAKVVALGEEVVPPRKLERRVERARVVAGVVRVAERRAVREGVARDHVAAADLDPVERELGGGTVDEPLDRERRLGPAGAAVGAGRHLRRAHARDLHVCGRDRVAADEERGECLRGDRRGRVEVGAKVGEDAAAKAEHPPIRGERQLRIDLSAASLVDGERVLGARLRPFDGAA